MLAEDSQDAHVTHFSNFGQWLLSAYVAGDEIAQLCEPILLNASR